MRVSFEIENEEKAPTFYFEIYGTKMPDIMRRFSEIVSSKPHYWQPGSKAVASLRVSTKRRSFWKILNEYICCDVEQGYLRNGEQKMLPFCSMPRYPRRCESHKYEGDEDFAFARRVACCGIRPDLCDHFDDGDAKYANEAGDVKFFYQYQVKLFGETKMMFHTFVVKNQLLKRCPEILWHCAGAFKSQKIEGMFVWSWDQNKDEIAWPMQELSGRADHTEDFARNFCNVCQQPC